MTTRKTAKYRIGTVARMTGLSVDVLRAWERRYGLLEPDRGPGGQRLYSDEDLQVLHSITQQLAQGRPIGEVALAGRNALLREPAQHGAGVSAPSGGLDAICRGVVEAAIALDGGKIQELLDGVFGTVPPEVVLARVIEPAARDIGEAWVGGLCSVAGEHLASALFIRRLEGMIHAQGSVGQRDRTDAICGCLPDELHAVPALIVAYYLIRMGVGVTYLGPSLPFEDLEAAILRLRPRGVYLSVSRGTLLDTHEPRLLDLIQRQAGRTAFFIGGRGVTGPCDELARAGAFLWPDARPVHELGPQLVPPERKADP